MTGSNTLKIVLSGTAGSGKSRTGMMLAEKLKFPFLSMGNFSRSYAETNYGMDIVSFQQLCSTDPGIDDALEKAFIQMCNNEQQAVIDYRLGFYFIPGAFSVLLTVTDHEAIRRVKAGNRLNEDAHTIPERNRKMRERFLKTYGLDFTAPENYTLVVSTDNKSPESICDLILHTATGVHLK
jgi:cytidylate kinase